MKKLFILIPFLTFMMADAINVSPSTLNYGQVVMGDNPTLSFTVSAELDQTVTITPPEFYSLDISEIEMVVGQEQLVNVTFSPPSVGSWDSQIVLTGSTFGTTIVDVNAEDRKSVV